MNKKIGLQIDPLHTLNIETDTSLILANEFASRGYIVYGFSPYNISLSAEDLVIDAFTLNFSNYAKGEVIQESNTRINLKELTAYLIRQNPPFDENYILNTYILERFENDILFINKPSKIRNFPEKLSVLNFPQYTPKTLITSSTAQANAFLHKHGKMVIKPIFGYGGSEVSLISSTSDISKAYALLDKYKFIILQEFLEDVVNYDKRVLIFNGKVLGAFERVPQNGSILANLVAGGVGKATVLSKKENEISQHVARFLKDNDVCFAGIDLIQEKLIEINITSPTGVITCNKLYNVQLQKLMLDSLGL